MISVGKLLFCERNKALCGISGNSNVTLLALLPLTLTHTLKFCNHFLSHAYLAS